MIWLLATLVCLLAPTQALDNGLAKTPPMGWMHWQRFRCLVDCNLYPDECISENLFKAMADRLVSDGYLAAGYEYLIIDDCWMSMERDARGRLQGDLERFPSGIKALSEYVHAKGLKFGIYGDYGDHTCQKYPGSYGHLETDIETFAEWGVDYLKLDTCHAEKYDLEDGYQEVSRLLNKTGRPIVFSCSYPAYQEPLNITSNYSLLSENCNLWRNWDDIDDGWSSMTGILKWFSTNQDRLAPFAGPGHWNDPDMLIIGNYGLSYEQAKAQMAIWAIMAAPLIMSVDLRTIEPQFRDILLNKDIIAISQDPKGIQGKLVRTISKIDVWTRPLQGEDEGLDSYAIGFISNRVDGYPYRVNVTLANLTISDTARYSIYDVYEKKSYEILTDDKLFVRVKPSGAVLLTATPIIEFNNKPDNKNNFNALLPDVKVTTVPDR